MSDPDAATFRPLEGIRVVEMSHMVMGPACGMFLTFLGADVIKVEPPEGDKTRQLKGMGRPLFPLFNRGKRSVSINLKTEAGKSALKALLATADVFIENFRDASLGAMGIEPEQLQAEYPGLIIASHKGFLHGPYENRTALDEVVQMMTGLAYMTGPSGRPLRVGSSANDIMGGLFGALSISCALLERKETGKGRNLRIGLFENSLLLVAQHMVHFDLEGTNPPPMPERVFSWPVYDVFTDADGRQIFVSAVADGHWTALCDILGLTELKGDARLQTLQQRIDSRSWTIPVFAKAIATRRLGDMIEAFEKVGISYAPIAKPGDMYADPHVLRPGGLDHSTMPDGSSFRAPSMPIEVDGSVIAGGGNVPDVGAQTREILSALCLSDAEIDAAKGTGDKA